MHETEAELTHVQQLLDRSFARSSDHLLSIMTVERRLDAHRLVEVTTGVCVLNIATVTARGEPRVSAVDGHFLHGHWYFTTDGRAAKVRQLAARPAISAAFTPRDGLGVFCHGRVQRLEADSDELRFLDEHWTLVYGVSFGTLSDDIACLRIDADWLVGFAMTHDEMAEIEAATAARAARQAAAEPPAG